MGGDGREAQALTDILISIHAPRVGGDVHGGYKFEQIRISIHAPRVGGDPRLPVVEIKGQGISIHAPRVGGDFFRAAMERPRSKFQSTPPVWGATMPISSMVNIPLAFQSTPPVWGATAPKLAGDDRKNISIHAPRGGGDPTSPWGAGATTGFQSTPPVWGATNGKAISTDELKFQSTPPVWGATCSGMGHSVWLRHFNPRPPCGGRQGIASTVGHVGQFQSTPPVWGATNGYFGPPYEGHISIHAPRVGGDRCGPSYGGWWTNFNPRPPCGGRLLRVVSWMYLFKFQSTPPVWGATRPTTTRPSGRD